MPDLVLLSQVLFGRSMRLPVAQYVLEKATGLVYQAEIADILRFKPTYVLQELERLAKLEMITELPKADSPRRYFQRVDHPFWEIIRVATEAVEKPVVKGAGNNA